MWKFFRRRDKDKENIKIKAPKSLMDFSDIKFDFNIKSICYFEKLVNKSFFELCDEDIMDMMYSIYIVNNPDKKMTKKMFNIILQREDVSRWMLKQYMLNMEIWQQFQSKYIKEETDKNDSNEDNIPKSRMIDYVNTLIIEYGVDSHYINYEMDVWELSELFEAIDTKNKRDMVDKRFWTYLNIMPHIDSKKCKSPEALLSFDWEKESIKKRKEKELNNNMYAIKNTIGKNIFGDKEDKDGR